MKITFILILLALCFSVSAKKLTFTFDILSSGPDIYPCNVGLKHEPVSSTHPVGDSTIDTSMSALDNFQTDYGTWDGWFYGEEETNLRVWGNDTENYATLFGDTDSIEDSLESSFGKMINDLSFNLSSENYGADYFIDVCYRKSQINTDDSVVANVWAWTTITDLGTIPDYSYINLAGLNVITEIYCTTGENGNGTPFIYESSTKVMDGSTVHTITDLPIITGTPKSCVVRFNFKETSFQNERRHQLQEAQVTVNTEIIEYGS